MEDEKITTLILVDVFFGIDDEMFISKCCKDVLVCDSGDHRPVTIKHVQPFINQLLKFPPL